ncbi:hypothetical protein [Saccharothrix texasensis]|uniref:Uncharacterized protein n=1 Tax=Saccharothrix texasensis TaxID=103734 RepID=A0A3N1H7E2_9PSEU|nr:hypothetical protein [Saccharothrix texasensis]ROP38351.1 hypothetical protein EDD40_3705 [Saccharothrix texasensis]
MTDATHAAFALVLHRALPAGNRCRSPSRPTSPRTSWSARWCASRSGAWRRGPFRPARGPLSGTGLLLFPAEVTEP